MNECTSSRQQLANIYKQLNNEVVSGLKEWLEQNQTLYQKISDCCEDANSNLSDINDILDEYIEILVDCCGGINGKLNLILTGIEDICIECVHVPVTPTTTEEHTQTTTAEPTPVTTGEPGPEECDSPTEVHEKGSFYPYGPITKYLGEEEGLVTLDYEVYKIPDRFVVFWNGEKVIDTGYHGLEKFEPMLNDVLVNEWGEDPVSIDPSMTGSVTFYKDKPDPYAYILVYAPLRNTAFNFILSCPYNTTTSSTTSTTTEEEFTSTSSEETDTTTARPCTLDIEVLFPPQPVATTTSTEEPATTTSSTTAEPGTTTSTTCGCPDESCGYGLLYNQFAILDERNIAPVGWHVPTYEEAKEMLLAYGGSEYVEEGYKETRIKPNGELQFMDTDPDYWFEGATGTNTTCFSARGNSYRYAPDGEFYSLNDWATWWLADSGYWMALEPTIRFSAGNWYTGYPEAGLGLRLVMDNPEEWYCGMICVGNDGDYYSTVKIGDQVWLGENSRETRYRNNDLIPEVTDYTEWTELTEGALCAYDNDWWENICIHRPQYYGSTTTTTTPEATTTTTSSTTTTTEEPATTTTTEYVPDAFIFEIEAGAETIELPLHTKDDDGNVATYDAVVYWDWENHPEESEPLTTASASHAYSAAGTYVVVIEGTCQTFATRSKTDTATHSIASKIKRVLKWGNVADFRLLNFYGCVNLTELPHDIAGNPFGASDGTITGASNILTFENFLYSCVGYVQIINQNLFTSTPDVITFKASFALSGVYGDIPSTLFETPAGNVLSFEKTFQKSNVGYLASNPLPSTLFILNINVTNFDETFFNVSYTTGIPSGLFSTNTKAQTFAGTFARTSYGTGAYWNDVVPADLFWNAGSSVTRFTKTFMNSGITGIDADYLFGNNQNALYFNETFHYCRKLTTNVFKKASGTKDGLFWNNPNAKTFALCFADCINITDSLEDCPKLFYTAGASVGGYNPQAETNPYYQIYYYFTDFSRTFFDCIGITGDIPESLFSQNVNVKYFRETFACAGVYYGYIGSSGTGVIPVNLFVNNTAALNFISTFKRQLALTLAPNGLFRANTDSSSISFETTFDSCNYLQIQPFIFSESTEASTQSRFNGKTVSFQGCFSIGTDGYKGVANGRCAPEIWDDIKYPALSKTKTNCFSLSTDAAYANYQCIPADWGGTGYDAGICATLDCAEYVTTTTEEP